MKEREDWIDYIKGIAIILVVLGHAIRPNMKYDYSVLNILFGVIYSIHMPLFFMVSGYLLTKSMHRVKCFLLFLKKKSAAYLVPFLSYSLIIYVMFKLFFSICKSSIVNTEDLAILSNYFYFVLKIFSGENPFLIHLWFLPALYIMVVCTTCLYFLTREKYKCLSIVIALFLLVLRVVFNIMPIHMLNMIMWQYIFFVQGLYLERILKILRNKKINIIMMVISLVVIIICVCLIEYVQVSFIMTIVLRFVKTFAALLFCCSVAGLCYLIKTKVVLSWLGKNSMAIYLLHQPFCCAFLGTVLYDKLYLPVYLVIIIEMFMSIAVILFVVSIIITRNRFFKKFFEFFFAIRYEELVYREHNA